MLSTSHIVQVDEQLGDVSLPAYLAEIRRITDITKLDIIIRRTMDIHRTPVLTRHIEGVMYMQCTAMSRKDELRHRLTWTNHDAKLELINLITHLPHTYHYAIDCGLMNDIKLNDIEWHFRCAIGEMSRDISRPFLLERYTPVGREARVTNMFNLFADITTDQVYTMRNVKHVVVAFHDVMVELDHYRQ